MPKNSVCIPETRTEVNKYTCNENKFKVRGKKLLKDELTGNPRRGQNVIDKVNMKIFYPYLAFKRRSEVCFVLFQVNKYV